MNIIKSYKYLIEFQLIKYLKVMTIQFKNKYPKKVINIPKKVIFFPIIVIFFPNKVISYPNKVIFFPSIVIYIVALYWFTDIYSGVKYKIY